MKNLFYPDMFVFTSDQMMYMCVCVCVCVCV